MGRASDFTVPMSVTTRWPHTQGLLCDGIGETLIRLCLKRGEAGMRTYLEEVEAESGLGLWSFAADRS